MKIESTIYSNDPVENKKISKRMDEIESILCDEELELTIEELDQLISELEYHRNNFYNSIPEKNVLIFA